MKELKDDLLRIVVADFLDGVESGEGIESWVFRYLQEQLVVVVESGEGIERQ